MHKHTTSKPCNDGCTPAKQLLDQLQDLYFWLSDKDKATIKEFIARISDEQARD